MSQLIKPLLASFIYFIIAGILGLTLRLAFVIEMPDWFDYRNVQHAHSHVALLGWLTGAFFLIIVFQFGLSVKRYLSLYWFLQATVLGMLVTFPMVGYAPASIAFSTLHIILSYVFVFRVWRDLNRSGKQGFPVLFLKGSLVFLVISTLGAWSIGPAMATELKGTAYYYGAIQFYLHYLFNGWFVFALLALFMGALASKGVTLSQHHLKRLFWVLTVSVVLTFALAVTWSTPHPAIFFVSSAGVLVQLVALILFLNWMKGIGPEIRTAFDKYSRVLLVISLVALILKMLVQTAVVIPAMAEISYTIRNFVVGFIHLLLLGSLSLFLFAMISHYIKRSLNIVGAVLFLLGVVSSEVILFTQGLMFWQGWGFIRSYYLLLAVSSGLIVLGTVIITAHLFYSIRNEG